MLPGHALTGPVAIDGARAGDVLGGRVFDGRVSSPDVGRARCPMSDRHIADSDQSDGMAGCHGGYLPLKRFVGVMRRGATAGLGRITSLIRAPSAATSITRS